jgi:type II secretory pathway pseudopilin PulG
MMTTQQGKGHTSRGLTLIELLVVIAITMILAALLLVAAARALGASRSSTCQSNLRQMGMVIGMYANENGGAFPKDLTTIYPQYLTDLGVLVCPSAGDSVGTYPQDLERWSSYDYHSSGEKAEMLDKKRIHYGRRNRVVYSNSLGQYIDSIE